MAKEKVLVAMSGGVDSSVVAGILLEEGYDVIGINIRTFKYEVSACDNFKSCCSPEDIQDAREVAMKLGIPFYSIPMEDLFFKRVIDPFIEDYKRGRTPNPCVNCNIHIKFGELFTKAASLGIPKIATGHYANIIKTSDGRYAVSSGVDQVKNQAYYLYGLSQENLRQALFPLGMMDKVEVRKIAAKMGLSVSAKKESQEICFIPENDYRKFLKRHEVVFTPGEFRLKNGKVLGKHDGKENFTIGQRKGLGISWQKPLYVIEIKENGTVIVGEEFETGVDYFTVGDINFMGEQIHPGAEFTARVQIRYRHQPIQCQVKYTGDKLLIQPSEPVKSVTPGQSAVFYHKSEDYVLFGGIILDDILP